MRSIETLLNKLKMQKMEINNSNCDFFIPVIWNYIGFNKIIPNITRPNEIQIDPYDFLIYSLENVILPQAQYTDEVRPLGLREVRDAVGQAREPFDLRKSIVYGLIPRMFTAWNHYTDGQLCPGTFLKAIPLLPFLRSLDVDVLYLLPIFEYSDIYIKGEIGSPYAVKNMFKLDPNLHDPILGAYSDEILELEFKAFVEACHILGIRVMIDFVFRTVARDNDLIVEHPDWFYWIELKHNSTFDVPLVEKEPTLTVLTDETLDSLYTCAGLEDYLEKFTYPPNVLDAAKWSKVVSEHRHAGENILQLIEKEYGITTVPGFSDVLNDIQPLWTDVTYLKFYFDTHPRVKKYIRPDQPPYILQDAVCLNLYHSEEPNLQLWEYIIAVIPHFQQHFGIDGARIDSGHALPPALNSQIIANIKLNNPDFVLWAEEFAAENTESAKRYGFDFITGNLWHLYKELRTPDFTENLMEHLKKAQIPVTAALETPDTPRCANVFPEFEELELVTMLNFFIPNAIQYINSGMEVGEIQPMNLGLDNTEAGKYVLMENDPMYGKLAFFDNYQLHWLAEQTENMLSLLTKGLNLRKRLRNIVSNPANFIWENEFDLPDKLLVLSYFAEVEGMGVFFLANLDVDAFIPINLSTVLPAPLNSATMGTLLYKNSTLGEVPLDLGVPLSIAPNEVIIGILSSERLGIKFFQLIT